MNEEENIFAGKQSGAKMSWGVIVGIIVLLTVLGVGFGAWMVVQGAFVAVDATVDAVVGVTNAVTDTVDNVDTEALADTANVALEETRDVLSEQAEGFLEGAKDLLGKISNE